MNIIPMTVSFLTGIIVGIFMTCWRIAGRQKNTLKCLALALSIPFGASFCQGQTNGLAIPIFGNLPPYQTNSTLFANGKLELRAAVSTGSTYQSMNSATYFITSAFGLTADAFNGGVNNLNAFHLGAEYGYAVGGLRLSLRGAPGLNIVTHRPEGVIQAFASYVPLNAAPNVFAFTGPSITIDKTSFKGNGSGIVNWFLGVGYRF